MFSVCFGIHSTNKIAMYITTKSRAVSQKIMINLLVQVHTVFLTWLFDCGHAVRRGTIEMGSSLPSRGPFALQGVVSNHYLPKLFGFTNSPKWPSCLISILLCFSDFLLKMPTTDLFLSNMSQNTHHIGFHIELIWVTLWPDWHPAMLFRAPHENVGTL